ncbi:collagen alpha-1(I) chain-like [Lutra lutra]|uniref:collagen alpha-1(I) chain-like n=1 Tax=Lutra lutra TaxID=9657 RepID=UPI001FD192AA|nr:collagen alpha-1(I) chain-like [Lutra lutra]
MEAITAVLDRAGKRRAPGLRPSPTLPSTGTPRPAGRRGGNSPQTHPGGRCWRPGTGKVPGWHCSLAGAEPGSHSTALLSTTLGVRDEAGVPKESEPPERRECRTVPGETAAPSPGSSLPGIGSPHRPGSGPTGTRGRRDLRDRLARRGAGAPTTSSMAAGVCPRRLPARPRALPRASAPPLCSRPRSGGGARSRCGPAAPASRSVSDAAAAPGDSSLLPPSRAHTHSPPPPPPPTFPAEEGGGRRGGGRGRRATAGAGGARGRPRTTAPPPGAGAAPPGTAAPARLPPGAEGTDLDQKWRRPAQQTSGSKWLNCLPETLTKSPIQGLYLENVIGMKNLKFSNSGCSKFHHGHLKQPGNLPPRLN